jgi:IS5 family transposase
LLRLPEELARVDALLDDPEFFAPFVPYFDPRIGRPSTPMETYLRLMFLKFRYGLGYESLCREVGDSISWRRFCRIDPGRWRGDPDQGAGPVPVGGEAGAADRRETAGPLALRPCRDVAVVYLPYNNRGGIDHLFEVRDIQPAQANHRSVLDRPPSVNVRRRSIRHRDCAWQKILAAVGHQNDPDQRSDAFEDVRAQLVKPSQQCVVPHFSLPRSIPFIKRRFIKGPKVLQCVRNSAAKNNNATEPQKDSVVLRLLQVPQPLSDEP